MRRTTPIRTSRVASSASGQRKVAAAAPLRSRRSPLAWSASILVAAVVAVFATPGIEGKEKKAKKKRVNPYELMVKDKFGKPDPEELALDSLSWAPNASAVMFLDALQREFYSRVTETSETRILWHRRVKILDDSAIERWSEIEREYGKNSRIEAVHARTILPDGTAVDAGDGVRIDESETQIKQLSISFPQVTKGAILESLVIHNSKTWSGAVVWRVQETIPVLDSRVIFAPRGRIPFQSAGVGVTQEELDPIETKSAKGYTYLWRFTDVPAIPDEPNRLPTFNFAKSLYVNLHGLSGATGEEGQAKDWLEFNKREMRIWDGYLSGTHRALSAWTKEVTAGASTELEKAEAIRTGLHQRLRASSFSPYVTGTTPDAVFKSNDVTSTDFAHLTVKALRQVGVDAEFVYIRHLEDGHLPTQFPMPQLFNDTLVRLPESGTVFSPAAKLPVGSLPAFASGVVALPLDGESKGPIRLPALSASANASTRMANLELGADGTLSGKVTMSLRGPTASEWRDRLEELDEERAKTTLADALDATMTGCRVTGLEMNNLEDHGKPLVLVADVVAEGYATAAGRRALVNPNVFDRVATSDWAAESRVTPIDMGMPFRTEDTVTIKIPDGVTSIQAPGPGTFDAGAAGRYTVTYEQRGPYIVTKRSFQLEQTQYQPQAWSSIRQWFSDMATQDEQPLVLEMGAS